MSIEAKQLLQRWESLRSGTGLTRAASVARALWFFGLVLFLIIVVGLYYGLSPVVLVIVSAVMGWVIAERNALKLRIAQWPVLAGYIDWTRINNDLNANQ
jgi:hypothetical protein